MALTPMTSSDELPRAWWRLNADSDPVFTTDADKAEMMALRARVFVIDTGVTMHWNGNAWIADASGLLSGDFGTPDFANGQLIAYTGVSAPIALAITASRVLIALTSDGFIKAATIPVALTTGASQRLPADVLFPMNITSGDKVAAISDGVDGTMYVMPLI